MKKTFLEIVFQIYIIQWCVKVSVDSEGILLHMVVLIKVISFVKLQSLF